MLQPPFYLVLRVFSVIFMFLLLNVLRLKLKITIIGTKILIFKKNIIILKLLLVALEHDILFASNYLNLLNKQIFYQQLTGDLFVLGLIFSLLGFSTYLFQVTSVGLILSSTFERLIPSFSYVQVDRSPWVNAQERLLDAYLPDLITYSTDTLDILTNFFSNFFKKKVEYNVTCFGKINVHYEPKWFTDVYSIEIKEFVVNQEYLDFLKLFEMYANYYEDIDTLSILFQTYLNS